MINEEWKEKTQNDAPFVTFYKMHAVTFVLPDGMVDVSIVELRWFIPFPNMSILGSSNSAANKDMMSKIGKMEIHLSDWVENIVGEAEIAC